MFAARLASSLWFRWSTSTMAAPQSAAVGDDPGAAIGQLARAAVSIEALERIRSSATDDAGVHRLLTHVIDDAHIRQMQPADIVSNTEMPALIAATGMPAAALTRAAARTGLLWRRRRLIRRLTVGALVAALALVAAFVVWTLFGGDSAVHAEDDRAAAAPGESIVVDVLANDSGGQGGLFITEVTPPTQGSIGLAGNGITYTAEPGASGVDSFGYQITDGGGSSARATVFVDIVGTATTSTTTTTSSTSTSIAAPANQLPLAGDDAATGREDEPLTIDVSGNDSDPDGDTLVVTHVDDPPRGRAEIVKGVVVYTPDVDVNGTDTFAYTIADGRGGEAGATVTVEIAPQNDPPTAGDDEAFVLEESRTAVDVLANDADVDGDALVVRLVDPPRRGQASVGDGGRILYSSLKVSAGTDAFTYSVDDGNAEPVIATVTVTIFPPVLIDSIQVAEDTSAQPADQRPAFTVKLRVATSAAVTVDYEAVEGTATRGKDYEDYPDPPGEFVFEIGESVASLPPPDIIDDTDDEPEGVVHRRADGPLPGRAREPRQRHGDDPHRRPGCGRRLGRLGARRKQWPRPAPGLGSAPC